MKLAICNETFQNWPHDRAFAFARECGYTGIEIAPFTLAKSAFEVDAAMRAELRELASRNQLEIIGLHWLLAGTEGYYLTTPDAAVRRRTAEYLEELAKLCRELGGSVMVLGSPKQRNLLPGVSHEQGIEFAADVLRMAMPTLERLGVTLAVEPLGPEEGDFLRTADSARDLISRVGSPKCRLHLDVKAMSTEEAPIPEIIRRNADLLAHFHANDPNRQGPGMGKVPFGPILQALQSVSYSGWVSVEVFDYSPGPERLASESIANLRRTLQEIGS